MVPIHPRTRLEGPEHWAWALFLVLLPLTTLVPYSWVAVWSTQDFVLRWASVLFIALVLGKRLLAGRGPAAFRVDTPDLLFYLLAFWVLLSSMNSQVPFHAFYGFRGFLAQILFWFGLRSFWERYPEGFPVFERVFYRTAIVAAFFVLLDVAGTSLHFPAIEGLRLIRQGTFPNQNIAAGFLGMALLWGTSQKILGRDVSWVGLGFLLAVWGLTESRGAFAAMTLTVVLYLVLNMKEVEGRIGRWGKAQWSAFGGGVLFLVACVSLMLNRLLNAEAIDPRSYFRLDVWVSTLKMIQAQPLFGFGPGTYGDVYPFYRPASLWNTSNPFAHNEFLQVGAECGLPALLLVALLLWALVWAFWPKRAGGRSEGSALPLAFYLLLFETIQNSVDFTFHEWSHRLVILGFVTYAMRGQGARGPMTADWRFSPWAFRGLTLALSLFILWALGVGSARDYFSRLLDLRSLLAQKRGDWATAALFAQKSLSLRPNNDDPWNSLGAIEDYWALNAPTKEERERHFDQADQYFQNAQRHSPFAEEPRTNQVQSLLQRGRWSQALELQKKLVVDGPLMPSHPTELGRIYLKMGRPKEAVGPAQKCIDQFPYFLPAYFVKAQALEALGRRSEALHTYEDAQQMLQNIGQEDPSGQVQPNIDRLKDRS